MRRASESAGMRTGGRVESWRRTGRGSNLHGSPEEAMALFAACRKKGFMGPGKAIAKDREIGERKANEMDLNLSWQWMKTSIAIVPRGDPDQNSVFKSKIPDKLRRPHIVLPLLDRYKLP